MAALKQERLVLSFKEAGTYHLILFKINFTITVNVVEGTVWERTSQVYSKKDKRLYVQYPSAHNYVGLSEKCEITPAENKYKVKCQLTYPPEVNG